MAHIVLQSFRSFSSICRPTNAGRLTENLLRYQKVASCIAAAQNPQHQPFRNSSFRSSSLVGDVAAEHPHVEVVRNPAEWKYVEAILAPPLVPKPLVREEYPSGWKPQTQEAKTLQYFVPRTKNHMHPVYLCTYFRGQRRLTKLRRIQGDIWLLEQELHKTIENHIGKEIVTRVNEMTGQISFKGDYVNIIKDFLMAKGL